MDNSSFKHATALDVSTVAGEITSILARRYEGALRGSDSDGAGRFDVGLDTVYFAALLLMIVNGSGETRERADVLAALDTVKDVVGDLRHWVRRQVP
jgi:hypothetical protein